MKANTRTVARIGSILSGFFFAVAVSDAALTLHWEMDETTGTSAADASGSGHAGVISGGAASDLTVPGMLGTAFEFTSSSEYVAKTNLALTVRSLAFWIYSAENIDSNVGTGGGEYVSGFGTGSGGNYKYVGIGNASGLMTGESVTIMDNTGTLPRSYVSVTLPAGWHHLAFVWNGSAYDIWTNGQKQPTSQVNSWSGPLTSDQIVAGRREDGSNAFDGTLDDYKIWDHALSSNEVVELYQSYFPPGAITNEWGWHQTQVTNILADTDAIVDAMYLAVQSGTVTQVELLADMYEAIYGYEYDPTAAHHNGDAIGNRLGEMGQTLTSSFSVQEDIAEDAAEIAALTADIAEDEEASLDELEAIDAKLLDTGSGYSVAELSSDIEVNTGNIESKLTDGIEGKDQADLQRETRDAIEDGITIDGGTVEITVAADEELEVTGDLNLNDPGPGVAPDIDLDWSTNSLPDLSEVESNELFEAVEASTNRWSELLDFSWTGYQLQLPTLAAATTTYSNRLTLPQPNGGDPWVFDIELTLEEEPWATWAPIIKQFLTVFVSVITLLSAVGIARTAFGG